MGRHSQIVPIPAQRGGAGTVFAARPIRQTQPLAAFSFWIALAIVLVTVIAPDSSASATERRSLTTPTGTAAVQQFSVAGDYRSGVERDEYRVTKPKPVIRAAPAAGTPDPGSAQAIAYELLQARGMGDDQYSCLVALWNRESGWNVYAHNPSSGAYGIPQALPGTKMATVAADWKTNPKTQIIWGLGYIAARYGTPCGAWAFFQNKGWY